MNDLPDSSFLWIESGGEKDDEGKTTPRSLRHLPYKDADGKVDIPHLRNALARIPQTEGLSESEQEALTKRAQGILDKNKELTQEQRSVRRKAMADGGQEPALQRGMVALYPTPDVAAMLALSGGGDGIQVTPAEELHITLAYFPEIDADEVGQLIQQVAAACTWAYGAITKITGTAQFSPGPSSDGLVPHVLLVDNNDSLQDIRNAINWNVYCVEMATNFGFTPHITRAYASPGTVVDQSDYPTIPLIFPTISLVIGDMRYDFSCMSAGGVPMPMAYRMSKGTGVEVKAGKRMNSGWRDKLSGVVDTITGLMKWASYDDNDDSASGDEPPEELKTFNVIKQADGSYRWLSFSSNGFEDKEREIVSTDALKSSVALADAGLLDRGPLRIFHIKNADVGRCDFQAVEGRFLIESGTWDDTPLAQAMLEYVKSADEKLGVSVGFSFPDTHFDGKVYKTAQIFERSLLPLEWAANPYTTIEAIKEVTVDEQKVAFLRKSLPGELVDQVIGHANKATAALEGLVAFKSKLDTADDGEGKPGDGTPDPAAAGSSSDTPDGANDEAQKDVTNAPVYATEEALKGVVEVFSEALKGQSALQAQQTELLQGLMTEVKGLRSAAEKAAEKEDHTPRGAGTYRASGADDNVVDASKDFGGESTDPVAPFIEMLKGMRSA